MRSISVNRIVATGIAGFFLLINSWQQAALADHVKLSASLGQPLLKAGARQVTYLKVGLTGFELTRKEKRTPVNLAIVVDKSGSMSGDKIARAREAAKYAVSMLSPNDIISLVAYSDSVEILVPATRATDKQRIYRIIEQLTSGGSTALFAGVSKGAAEVRKFKRQDMVNRIILLSDGLANVGPSSPAELGDLGALLACENITVTTIGIGLDYNEDLMVNLARRSDGNHAFVENPRDLVRIFKHELGDVLSVVAQDVNIGIRLANGVRPIRVLGRDAEIAGNRINVAIRQLYSKQEKFVMLEIEVPAAEAGASRKIADVSVSYANMQTRTRDSLKSSLSARFTDDTRAVTKAENRKVMIQAIRLVANETNKLALALRDQGKIREAKTMLNNNTWFIRTSNKRYNDADLSEMEKLNDRQSMVIDKDEKSEEYKRYRKDAIKKQYEEDVQQAW